ncbi:hypothetical protein KBC03_08010 [Patescibacteria group bacterium]|nr:hypothetical protein [Patescibacteria group bacterium]
MNTGKFAGEEHLPGRNPRFDAKLDWLERNGKYMAANGNKVHFRGAYDSQWTSHNCGALLAEILGFKPHLGDDRDQFEKDQEFLGKQMVLDGLAEHHMMPS